MRAFCRIVERESFARAAEDLGVSPALLSREVKLLEDSLGCTLLSRTTRSMSLTEHGRLYYGEAQRVLAEIAALEDSVRKGAATPRGTLRINVPHSFGTTALGPLLPRFMAEFPEIALELSFEDRVVDMIEGGYDLSLRIRPWLPDSNLTARAIAPVRQRLYASPAYLERHGIPQTPDDLTGHAQISFQLSEDADCWTLTGPEGTARVPLQPKLRLGSSLVLRDMLIAGQGIGSLPDFIADAPEAEGLLRRVLPGHELARRHVYAVTANRLGADAKTLAFVEFLRAALRRD